MLLNKEAGVLLNRQIHLQTWTNTQWFNGNFPARCGQTGGRLNPDTDHGIHHWHPLH